MAPTPNDAEPPSPAEQRSGSAGIPAPADALLAASTFSGPTVLQVGRHNVQHLHFPAPPVPVLWPCVIGLPPHGADGYVRRALPVDLDAPDTDGGALTSWVLTGLGGTGKTQIAAEHAGRLLREGRLDLLLWINAATRDSVLSAYGRAGEALFGASSGNPERTAAEFMAWLLHRPPAPGESPRRWLVVLDDVSAPSDLRGLWPPSSPHGRATPPPAAGTPSSPPTGAGQCRSACSVRPRPSRTSPVTRATSPVPRAQRATAGPITPPSPRTSAASPWPWPTHGPTWPTTPPSSSPPTGPNWQTTTSPWPRCFRRGSRHLVKAPEPARTPIRSPSPGRCR